MRVSVGQPVGPKRDLPYPLGLMELILGWMSGMKL